MAHDIVLRPVDALGPAGRRYSPPRGNPTYTRADMTARASAIAMMPGCPALGRLALEAFVTALGLSYAQPARDVCAVLAGLTTAATDESAAAWQLALDRLAVSLGLEVRP